MPHTVFTVTVGYKGHNSEAATEEGGTGPGRATELLCPHVAP